MKRIGCASIVMILAGLCSGCSSSPTPLVYIQPSYTHKQDGLTIEILRQIPQHETTSWHIAHVHPPARSASDAHER